MLDFDPNDADVIWARRVRYFNSDDPRPHRLEKSLTIKSARLLVGMSQKELATFCGVSTETVKRWETLKTIPNERYMDKITWVKLQAARNPVATWDCAMIKALRYKLDLSQTDAARLFNVSRATVARWEAGITSPDVDLQLEIRERLED